MDNKNFFNALGKGIKINIGKDKYVKVSAKELVNLWFFKKLKFKI